MSELRKTLTIVNQRGLHARASARFVEAVSALPETVSVRVAKGGNSAAGGSILDLMMLGAAKGDVVELIVGGDDAAPVMDQLAALIENGFGEE
ncbi:MAG: HPr family phosphocarrier protein [Parerythrobacter sp.]